MCFSWQITDVRTLAAEVRKHFGRMLEEAGGFAGLARGHRRRQIDQPAGVDGEPAHHLERGRRVFFTDRDVAAQAGRNESLAEHVIGIEQIVAGLLGGQRGSASSSGRKGRAGWL